MGHLAVIACDYDTGFEALAPQVRTKVAQLDRLGVTVDLFIAGPEGTFIEQAGGVPGTARVGLHTLVVPPGTQKGAALRAALEAALAGRPFAVAYLNLNPKVDAGQLRPALERLESPDVVAVVGTRSPREGGAHLGQGRLGTLKTLAFNVLARGLFPSLADFLDTNAPLKLMRADAAAAVLARARVSGLAFDCEWLLILQSRPGRIERLPIVWRQRPGSRPPYGQLRDLLSDLRHTRAAWLRGDYGSDE